jgi:hypothetical protein
MMAVKVLVKADNGKQAALMPSSLMPIDFDKPEPPPEDAEVELFPDLPPVKPKRRHRPRKSDGSTKDTKKPLTQHKPPQAEGDGWKPYVRRAHRAHGLEARVATGEEEIGDPVKKRVPKGDMICRNPGNGHLWTMTIEAFNAFYVGVKGR